jgi:adenine-specific DNA-methyltransferase
MPFLDWVNKNQAKGAPREVPYHLLKLEQTYGDKNNAATNLLIHGDNLLALKALLPFYAGRVKCIFIDPPYNTKSAFEHYDDNLEHSQWLSMMYPRLALLRDLLSEDGSIWVTVDDNEAHYLKVLMDEVFGRKNFVANVIWEKSDSPKMDSQYFSSRHDHVLVFARTIEKLSLGRVRVDAQEHYNRVDEHGRKFYTKPLRAMGNGEDTREARPSMFFPLTAPDGKEVLPVKPDGTDGRWRWGPDKVAKEMDRIEWVRGKNGWAAYYRIYEDTSKGRPPETIWPHTQVGSNRTSKAEVKAVFGAETTFTTPKPEGFLRQILEIATDPGDLVLDSFLGSGTTTAVAHKMGRSYIGIEMGEHARTHCLPRLEKVISGEPGGISAEVGWAGGGGCSFYTLGDPAFDESGRLNPSIQFETLGAYIWTLETGRPGQQAFNSLLLGVHDDNAYFLLFNGVLGDRMPQGGNVLTNSVLAHLRELHPSSMPLVVYGEASRLGPARLVAEGITFKQIPYDVKMR